MRVSDLVPDELWEAVGPLLPPERPKPNGGWPRVDDRAALAGIVYVVRQGAGIWERAPRTLLQWLGDLDAIDLGPV